MNKVMDSRYQANSYKNVMELLVDEEIDHQTSSYTLDEAHSINRVEVAAYALNLLPPLYASSQEGVELQYQRGQKEFSNRLKQAVTQALRSIAQHPQRQTTPFSQTLEAVPELQTLAESFQNLP